MNKRLVLLNPKFVNKQEKENDEVIGQEVA
jgi:hypothetical protein